MTLCVAIIVVVVALTPFRAQEVLGASASQVSSASYAVIHFSDPAHGVGFDYPGLWTLSDEEPYMFGMRLQNYPQPGVKSHVKALLYAKQILAVASWPETNFSGVEFGYDAQPVASASACRAFAREGIHPGKVNSATVKGRKYWHWTDGDGGMSQSVEDDLYATFVPSQAGGSCLLFDLAVHRLLASGDSVDMRTLTPQELAAIHKTLQDMLSSVRLARPGQ